ncbi:MerR family transcriptional regulator [Chondrinema litorale]|uniref:MerR family transcriptional regulator n=1 Tax=Chondrinema litorale TaxID=2994555 RepID=UPI002543D7F9|nr:MerR family transcriptional regulator [Chondrinema litorale]UZR99887.1 MerR family transcriptional regulator [Chondrinema litorale]
MIEYSVQKLAKISGVSVRTLHHYDQIGLLKPKVRTEAGYRLYGEEELLRLQQILFYKTLAYPLKEIARILDDPQFDLIASLSKQKDALDKQKQNLETLINTINKTIFNLKNKKMLDHEELYEGLPKEKAAAYREEAIKKWGKQVEEVENQLRQLSKTELHKLKADFKAVNEKLASLTEEDPTSEIVQQHVALHYTFIRKFWGTMDSEDKQAKAYVGLGDLYVSDNRYTEINGEPNADFADFMSKAMKYFASTSLK